MAGRRREVFKNLSKPHLYYASKISPLCKKKPYLQENEYGIQINLDYVIFFIFSNKKNKPISSIFFQEQELVFKRVTPQ